MDWDHGAKVSQVFCHLAGFPLGSSQCLTNAVCHGSSWFVTVRRGSLPEANQKNRPKSGRVLLPQRNGKSTQRGMLPIHGRKYTEAYCVQPSAAHPKFTTVLQKHNIATGVVHKLFNVLALILISRCLFLPCQLLNSSPPAAGLPSQLRKYESSIGRG